MGRGKRPDFRRFDADRPDDRADRAWNAQIDSVWRERRQTQPVSRPTRPFSCWTRLGRRRHDAGFVH